MKLLITAISLIFAVGCGDSTPRQEDCKVVLSLNLMESSIDADSTSTAIYEADLNPSCVRFMTTGQGQLEMLQIQNSNKAFRFNGFSIGPKVFDIAFLELHRAELLMSSLHDGFHSFPRDSDKSEARLIAEEALLDNLQMPFDMTHSARIAIEGDVLGQPSPTIEVQLTERL